MQWNKNISHSKWVGFLFIILHINVINNIFRFNSPFKSLNIPFDTFLVLRNMNAFWQALVHLSTAFLNLNLTFQSTLY